MTKIQIIKSKGQWYSRILAPNGEILWHSEKYTRKQNAYKTLKGFFKRMSDRISMEENEKVVFQGFLPEITFHLSNKK